LAGIASDAWAGLLSIGKGIKSQPAIGMKFATFKQILGAPTGVTSGRESLADFCRSTGEATGTPETQRECADQRATGFNRNEVAIGEELPWRAARVGFRPGPRRR
jgi:hypothetical protein